MRVLVTGFAPFAGDAENASAAAVVALARRGLPNGHTLATATLPVEFAAVEDALQQLVAHERPDLVVAVGEAGGRDAITPERVARNRIDARIPDNAGDQPREVPVRVGGAAQLHTRVDLDVVLRALRRASIPAAASDDAGAFVCNQVAYLCYELPMPALFVHVPAVRSPGAQRTVGAETDVDAHPVAHPAADGRALNAADLGEALGRIVGALLDGCD